MPDGNTSSSRRVPPAEALAASDAAQQRLRASSYHALRDVRCELMDGAMVLRGRVASFYFKQLAQEAVRKVSGACRIVNQLEVEDGNRSAANRANGQANGKTYVHSTDKQGGTRRQPMDVRILIVDDHPTVRESLRFVFAAAGIEHLMEATTCQDAIDVVRENHVDLVLLDVTMSDGNGLDALWEMKATDASVPVLVHSYHDHPRLLSQSFHAGAAGYVVKGNDKNALLHAVRQAAAGGSVWTAEQKDQIRESDAEFEMLVPARSAAVYTDSK